MTTTNSSKEDQHPTTPPSLQPPETTLDNNTVNQIIPSAKRALQFEKELHIDQPRYCTHTSSFSRIYKLFFN